MEGMVAVASVDVRDSCSISLELGSEVRGSVADCAWEGCCTSSPSTYSVASGEGQAVGELGTGPDKWKEGCSNLYDNCPCQQVDLASCSGLERHRV